MDQFKKKFSENAFFRKLSKIGIESRDQLVFVALQLYYAFRREQTPVWAKSVILGALGYFISLLDFIPDFTPLIGYTDDLSVLLAAVSALAVYIDDKVNQQAREKFKELFGYDHFGRQK